MTVALNEEILLEMGVMKNHDLLADTLASMRSALQLAVKKYNYYRLNFVLRSLTHSMYIQSVSSPLLRTCTDASYFRNMSSCGTGLYVFLVKKKRNKANISR